MQGASNWLCIFSFLPPCIPFNLTADLARLSPNKSVFVLSQHFLGSVQLIGPGRQPHIRQLSGLGHNFESGGLGVISPSPRDQPSNKTLAVGWASPHVCLAVWVAEPGNQACLLRTWFRCLASLQLSLQAISSCLPTAGPSQLCNSFSRQGYFDSGKV